MRTLEAVGIVEIRMGLKGGAWIAHGNANRFADALSIQLQLIGVTAQEILDTQLAIDPVAAAWPRPLSPRTTSFASKRPLPRASSSATTRTPHRLASINFHDMVIQCSRNRVLLAQFRALRSVLQPLVRPQTTEDVMQRLMRSNRALISALASGDSAEAARLMRDRVSAIRTSLLGIKPMSKDDAPRRRDR